MAFLEADPDTTQVSANGSTWVTVFDSAVPGEYPETAEGKTHTFPAQSVRPMRDYLNGSDVNVWNLWVEIAVWGTRITIYAGPHYEWNVQAGVGTSYYCGLALWLPIAGLDRP